MMCWAEGGCRRAHQDSRREAREAGLPDLAPPRAAGAADDPGQHRPGHVPLWGSKVELHGLPGHGVPHHHHEVAHPHVGERGERRGGQAAVEAAAPLAEGAGDDKNVVAAAGGGARC